MALPRRTAPRFDDQRSLVVDEAGPVLTQPRGTDQLDPEVYFNLDMSLDDASAPCGTPVAARAALAPEVSAWKAGLDNGYWESVGVKPLLTSTAH